jgi:hypothetical protein
LVLGCGAGPGQLSSMGFLHCMFFARLVRASVVRSAAAVVALLTAPASGS